jgi:hypothetical protein
MAQRRLLTDEGRQARFCIPLDSDGMARRFSLSRADQELVADASAGCQPDWLRCPTAGCDLVCCCAPLLCHGDVPLRLLELARP